MDYVAKKGLKDIRRSYGLTQSELAKMFGLSQMHISLVELGKLTFLPHQRAAFESILGPIEWEKHYLPIKRSINDQKS
jgi:transcriptional regulator with XRE-family HTH domain